ncbi:MAG: DUF502 domain-containing protein [Rubrivivax sp.]|uniref:DUF502 domain-containing protein n=1 Tax=Ottowia sp. TaxID=1898956 RepID=UPI00217816B8|nr:DUF502 domain-containing protein [Ottowia sp.]MCC6812770.1 DUF502 domain-containing protein [Rubrivivax sp.]MCZ2089266.1 DUF502 domain-containing protein [Burkholderiales bacterium]HNR82413.1 DUF502 domain-containing protein [Ottowia sp.]HNT84409.1 DUF502 domain-containing protein [Ottowia sp.]HOZ94978.1 DUF502 domain-containing protein [Ottowia sp.]
MMSRLRQYFITGLLVWLPMGVTVWVLLWLLGILDGIFLGVLSAAEAMVPGLGPLANRLRHVPGLGVILVAIVIFSTGVFVANMFGQWSVRQWDRLMTRIPVVRSIYSGVKQVSDTLFSGNGQAFSKALLIQYPRPGAWTIAFVTGKPEGEVSCHLPPDCISVYVPTTPNPTSGFFLMVPRADAIELRMSVDEALKYVISMGVVAPPQRQPCPPGEAVPEPLQAQVVSAPADARQSPPAG